MIKIVGLVPGSPDALTIGAVKALEESKNLYFRTEKHPTVDYLKNGLKSFKTCDNYYEEGSSFDEVYSNIANEMIEEYKKYGELVYAVPGHPLVAERSVLNLINLCNENNIEYKILPAVSFVDAMMDRLQIDPIEGLKIIDAFDIKNQILDKRIGTIITQVYNHLIASEVKLELLEYYNDETEIYYVRAAGIQGEESIRKIPLYELDMQEDIDYLTSVYIPKDINNKKDFYDLVNTIEILRSEDGCAWDREQTHESIKNCLIEEAYETVFGDAVANTSNEVLQNWDELKKKEKNYETLSEEIDGIAKALPALTKAHKVKKKVSKVGFDFENINEAIKKIEEEINEVLDVYKSNNREKIIKKGKRDSKVRAIWNSHFQEIGKGSP